MRERERLRERARLPERGRLRETERLRERERLEGALGKRGRKDGAALVCDLQYWGGGDKCVRFVCRGGAVGLCVTCSIRKPPCIAAMDPTA